MDWNFFCRMGSVFVFFWACENKILKVCIDIVITDIHIIVLVHGCGVRAVCVCVCSCLRVSVFVCVCV